MEIFNSHYTFEHIPYLVEEFHRPFGIRSPGNPSTSCKEMIALEFSLPNSFLSQYYFSVIKLAKDISVLFQQSEHRSYKTCSYSKNGTYRNEITKKFPKVIAFYWNVVQLTELVRNITWFLWRLLYNRSQSAITVIIEEYLHIAIMHDYEYKQKKSVFTRTSTANTFYLSLKMKTCMISVSLNSNEVSRFF